MGQREIARRKRVSKIFQQQNRAFLLFGTATAFGAMNSGGCRPRESTAAGPRAFPHIYRRRPLSSRAHAPSLPPLVLALILALISLPVVNLTVDQSNDSDACFSWTEGTGSPRPTLPRRDNA
ncbi:hypothetical protein FB451DRAFT_1387197 [Mycena latifolia]|nr:hypothetical protein FB451DRAFT_1387197 [Mycena latifolia]